MQCNESIFEGALLFWCTCVFTRYFFKTSTISFCLWPFDILISLQAKPLTNHNVKIFWLVKCLCELSPLTNHNVKPPSKHQMRLTLVLWKPKLWNQVPSLDHLVIQNSGDFLCWKLRSVGCSQSPTGYRKRTAQLLRATHFYDLLM